MGIYESLGIKRIINCWGTVTKIGGSKMDQEILDAMNEAGAAFVDIGMFHTKAGERIAELLGCDAACITSGAAAGLAITAAAGMTKGELSKTLQLPDTTRMRNEVLVFKSHTIHYDQALLLSGAKLKEVGVTSSANVAQLEAAISRQNRDVFLRSRSRKDEGVHTTF